MLLSPSLEFQFKWFAPIDVKQACWSHLLPSTLRVNGLTGYLTILTHWLCMCFVYLQNQISKKLQVKLTDDCGMLLRGCNALEILQCDAGTHFWMVGFRCERKKDNSAQDDSHAPVINSDWRIIRADTQMSPITVGQMWKVWRISDFMWDDHDISSSTCRTCSWDEN